MNFPIEVHAQPGQFLGMRAEDFLRNYWQKRPLLIRNAFASFHSPISPEELAGLACEEDALARLVQRDRQKDYWSLRNGPFVETDFPALPDHDWTVLVQDVDKWEAKIHALLVHFNFLPRWRIDDVMISFAAPGGSVGAHVDQYDVFLLQALGERHWHIDARPNPPLAFREDVELKLLRQFDPSHDWVLAPGDMLYLPPNVPHHGIATTSCLTFSFGMRAPSAAELLSDWADEVLLEADEALRYQDPDLQLPADPNEIDTAALQRALTALNSLRSDDPQQLGDWFGRFITRYRSPGLPVADADALPSWETVEAQLRHQNVCLQRHPLSRMAWRADHLGAQLYVCGQNYPLSKTDARLLAGAEQIDNTVWEQLSPSGHLVVQALYLDGHYLLPE